MAFLSPEELAALGASLTPADWRTFEWYCPVCQRRGVSLIDAAYEDTSDAGVGAHVQAVHGLHSPECSGVATGKLESTRKELNLT